MFSPRRCEILLRASLNICHTHGRLAHVLSTRECELIHSHVVHRLCVPSVEAYSNSSANCDIPFATDYRPFKSLSDHLLSGCLCDRPGL
jgi:hypothetical protein